MEGTRSDSAAESRRQLAYIMWRIPAAAFGPRISSILGPPFKVGDVWWAMRLRRNPRGTWYLDLSASVDELGRIASCLRPGKLRRFGMELRGALRGQRHELRAPLAAAPVPDGPEFALDFGFDVAVEGLASSEPWQRSAGVGEVSVEL